ncbi:MAG TPA: 4Fe-4S binding protein [Deltaproteobacteria bacterium]|nr:4Fe-4S binding protein [Deltaproteobacteria bacterium]
MSLDRNLAFQIFRKGIQCGVLVLVIYAAVGAHWRNFKVAHNSSRMVSLHTNEAIGELYWRNEQLLSLLGEPLAVSEGLLGGPWAMTVGAPVIDPWAIAVLLVQGVPPTGAMLAGALLPIGLAVVLGRVFCSFLCPARLLFEAGNAVRRGLQFLGLTLPAARLPRVGLWVGLGALAFAASAGPAIFSLVLPYASISTGILASILTGSVATVMIWAAVLVAVDALIAPGQICHALCPTGALLEQLGRGSIWGIARSGGSCPPSCDVCQRVCPYGLFPGRRTHRPSCDSCGRCAVACPQHKLGHKLRWGVAALAAALIAAGQPAHAHHNKGLPHYGYFDNYPQVPTEEFIDEVGDWEVGAVFFNFQGMQRRTSDTPNDVRVFAYAYDLESERGYRGEATLHIDDASGQRLATFARLQTDQEGVYVLRQELPSSGDYTLVFELEDDGGTVAVPLAFTIDLEADRVPWGLLGAAAGAVALLFLIASVSGRARGARRAPPASA